MPYVYTLKSLHTIYIYVEKKTAPSQKCSYLKLILDQKKKFTLPNGTILEPKKEEGKSYGRPTFRPIHFRPTSFRLKIFAQSISSNPNLT